MTQELDGELFFRRLNKIYVTWKENKSSNPLWADCDSICVLAGKASDEDSSYKMSVIIQMYLLGFVEFPETFMIFTDGKLIVCTSGRKYDMLETMNKKSKPNSGVTLELLKRNKSDKYKGNYEQIIAAIRGSFAGNTVGMLTKENPLGDFVGGFKQVIEDAEFKQVDVAKALETCVVTKEWSEVENIRWASALSSKVFKLRLLEDIENIIDEEKSVKHSKIAADVESVFEDPSKIKITLDPVDIESCYSPIIQSGGTYDMKPTAESTSSPLKYDVIIASIGGRYKGYCSNVARTYFIDPTRSMEKHYELLSLAHDRLCSALKPGAVISKVVTDVKHFIELKNPKLIGKLGKNFGFGIGLQFRESTMLLSTKNSTIIKPGMVFNVSMSFQDLSVKETEKAKAKVDAYSIMIADTVAVMETESKVFTKVSKTWGKVHYEIGDTEGDVHSPRESDIPSSKKPPSDEFVDTSKGRTRNQVLESRLRDQQRRLQGTETDQERRERHQAELMKRKREEALRRINEANGADLGEDKSTATKIEGYKSPGDYPSDLKSNMLYVDMKAECLFLPINGTPVPFHVNTVKNVSKSEEEKATYLRINFYSPGAALGKDAPPVMARMVGKFEHERMFIKELGFRSVNARNLNIQFRMIKELQKRVKQRELRAKEEEDLVVQEDLKLTRDRRVLRLSDLFSRPHFSGRKTQGTLEAHQNGLRFVSTKNEKLDILYSNIKHALFQPCERELLVLIHFHLRNHIMIGKKKQKDVQFYTEVLEASQALDNRRRSMYDPDELDEENRERALRAKLNETFRDFSKKVEGCADRAGISLSFDIPYRELSFQGTPYKEMVLLQPSVNCLVNLTEHPFFIVSLEDIEHVHCERVMFAAKNFDMVIILKDFKIVPIRISTIPTAELDSIKEWLDDIDIVYTTGPANLNWKSIMETIRNDERFYLDTDEDGMPKPTGWEFLKMEGSDDDVEEEDSASDSNFSDGAGSEEEEEEEDSEDASEWDGIVSEASSSAPEEDDDDAPTWEELEEEARTADKQGAAEKRRAEEEEDQKHSSRKRRRR